MNSFTLRIKLSSGCKRSYRVDCLTICSNCRFLFLRASRAGNRSLIRPMKIGISSVTTLGQLKSHKACISTWKRVVNNTLQEHSIFPFVVFWFYAKAEHQKQLLLLVAFKWRFYLIFRSVLVSLFQWSSSYQNVLDSMRSPAVMVLWKH